jgi:hypothetical protein
MGKSNVHFFKKAVESPYLCSGVAPCRLTMNDNRLIQALIKSEVPPDGEGDDGGL